MAVMNSNISTLPEFTRASESVEGYSSLSSAGLDVESVGAQAKTRSSLLSLSVSECSVALMTALVLFIAMFISGCSSKQGKDGAADGAYNGLEGSDYNSQLAARYGAGSIPEAEGDGIFKDIRFAFDSYTIDNVARDRLNINVEVLRANPGVKVQLEGHCDERGTSEYNLALGQRRAEAVRDALLALGIERSRIETISYGSEVPLDPRSNEEAWAMNRRVHFTPFTDQ